jgi:hypothetical protein
MTDFVQATEKLRTLEDRITAVEASAKSCDNSEGVERAIYEYQTQMLARLK